MSGDQEPNEVRLLALFCAAVVRAATYFCLAWQWKASVSSGHPAGIPGYMPCPQPYPPELQRGNNRKPSHKMPSFPLSRAAAAAGLLSNNWP